MARWDHMAFTWDYDGFYTMKPLMGSVVKTLWALFSFSFCRVSEGCVTWGLI